MISVQLALVLFVGTFHASTAQTCQGLYERNDNSNYCYKVVNVNSNYQNMREACLNENTNAKLLTFEDADHLADFVSFYNSKETDSSYFDSKKYIALGYAGIIDLPTNDLLKVTQFDDASEQDIDLAYTANKHVPSNSGSDDDDSDPKKCTVYNVKDEQSGGLIPITVTCNGGTNFNSDTVAVCWNKISENIVCKSDCNCEESITGPNRVARQMITESPCTFNFTASSSDSQLVVRIPEFNVARTGCCRDQHLRVEDGTGAFRRFCGEKPEAVKSNDNRLILRFYGPINSYANSFVADIESVNSSDTTQLLETLQRPAGR